MRNFDITTAVDYALIPVHFSFSCGSHGVNAREGSLNEWIHSGVNERRTSGVYSESRCHNTAR